MTNYDQFSKFYDAVMGDRSKTVALIQQLIKTNHPKARTVLELACGTGTILKPLAKGYDVYGIDLSGGMLRIAKRQIPKGKFYKQDMSKFKLPFKVDVIYCVFDSVNHLLSFRAWKSLFVEAYKHLNKNGVFIFDMNTNSKLTRHSKEPTWVRKFGNSYMLMKVQDKGRGIFNWDIKIFEWLKGHQFKFVEENIKEANFSITKVKLALSQFSSVKLMDTKNKNVSEKSDRVFFICKK